MAISPAPNRASEAEIYLGKSDSTNSTNQVPNSQNVSQMCASTANVILKNEGVGA